MIGKNQIALGRAVAQFCSRGCGDVRDGFDWDARAHEHERDAREHGAGSASYTLLRLPHEVAGLFREWLDWHAPEKAARVMSVLYDLRGQRANDARFGSRMTGLGHFAELLRQRFDLACRRCGLSQALPRRDSSQFTAPRRADANEDRQLSLF